MRCTAVEERRYLRIGLAAAMAISMALTAGQASAASRESLVGRKIEGFELHDARGPMRSLKDFAGSKLVVVAFLGTECPLANLYAPRLAELAKRYDAKDVAFVGINSNQQDSITEVAAHAKKMGFPFPVLKDPGNVVADQFGAERTPEVFVLDQERVIRYCGRIDDQYVVGVQRKQAEHHDLEDAIQQLLEGGKVTKAVTDAPGCLIGRVLRPDPKGEVTYSKQIARILRSRCVECHHEGQVAPFVLTSYEETVGWAETIREVVHARRMPPWQASPDHGKFKNDPSLSDEELATIDRWVENGCPEGDPADLPPPTKYAKGWGISEPDQVFYMSDEPYTIPAEGVVNYQYYVVDPGFTEDHWIKEAEVKAGNPSVVHHVIVFIEQPGADPNAGPQMAFAPGMTPRRLGEGAAIRAKAGCKLRFQNHYTPNGVEQQDRSYVGFVYAKPEEVKYEVLGGQCGNLAIRIPPQVSDHVITARRSFRRDTILLGMNPHMHVRGKTFRYELEYPDGRKEILLDVPRYDFNWQLWYMFQEPKLIPKGSKMLCTATFDNSPENPSNPDPTKEVHWGEQTWDEMMFGFYSTMQPVDPGNADTSKTGATK